MKSRALFTELMKDLFEVFNRDATKRLLRNYWDVLKPYDDKQCEAAIRRLIAKSDKGLPWPVAILNEIELQKAGQGVTVSKCVKCGRTDIVPGENLCKKCYGVVKRPKNYFKNIYKMLDENNSMPS